MLSIDLNCDLGEIDGSEGEALDASLMPYVSSINVACGGHAGGPDRIRKVVERALSLHLAIGAHPGYADRVNFGRIVVPMSPQEIHDLVSQQIQVVARILEEFGGTLHHVKPHGALYNLAATSPETALAIAEAIRDVEPDCHLVGLSGSSLPEAASAVGLRAVHEVFADRNYLGDGSLVPRSQPNALLHDASQIAARAASMVETGDVVALDGTRLKLKCDSLCIHSDTPDAVVIAAEIQRVFGERAIAILASGR